MSDGRRGYSSSFVKIVRNAKLDPTVAGFAEYCIKGDIGVEDLARMFGVARSTVYFWFKGQYTPRERHLAKMRRVLDAQPVA
jgi:DNA-binding XRE family transcriptional regulator